MRNTRLFVILGAVAALLLLPLIAMQFTDEVDWSVFDFLIAGALLLAAGVTFEFLARRRHSGAYRWTVGVIVGAALVVVWLELAVGVFGTPWAGS